MKALATYVMRGRMQAAGAAGFFGLTALVFPPLSFVSGAIIALAGLRHGTGQAATVAALAMIIFAAVSIVSLGTAVPLLVQVVAVWLPAIVGAEILRQTQSQGYMIFLTAILGLFAAYGLRFASSDVVEWWRSILQTLIESAFQGQTVTPDTAAIQSAAEVMTSLLAAGLMMNIIIYLLLARWWQSLLYLPGGFREEFRKLQLPKLLLPVVLGAALFNLLTSSQLFAAGPVCDLLVVAMTAYMFQGLAVMHVLADRHKTPPMLVGLMYLLLLFSGALGLMLLSAAGMVDAVKNIRGIDGKSGNLTIDK